MEDQLVIDRKKFFNLVRKQFYPKGMTQETVDGFNIINSYWEDWYDQDLRKFAYVLATVFHETAFTMEPIKERGGPTYLKSKKYWPWYGRGYIQLTWKENYERMGEILGEDLTSNPDVVMGKGLATKILFEGMYTAESGVGDFTRKALKDYFNDKDEDPYNARRIVNGLDKARKIGNYYQRFLIILRKSTTEVKEKNQTFMERIRSWFRS